jgi:4-carboxymuconolactone decarboxylase
MGQRLNQVLKTTLVERSGVMNLFELALRADVGRLPELAPCAVGGYVGPGWNRNEGEMNNLGYKDQLRRLAVNDSTVADALPGHLGPEPALDPKTLALIRIAALVAERGPVPSLGEQADAAWTAGATGGEIVGVLIALIPVLGLPCVVDAAPKMALALGFDIEEAL